MPEELATFFAATQPLSSGDVLHLHEQILYKLARFEVSYPGRIGTTMTSFYLIVVSTDIPGSKGRPLAVVESKRMRIGIRWTTLT